jgi:hypothetical protein
MLLEASMSMCALHGSKHAVGGGAWRPRSTFAPHTLDAADGV